jgi:hypothetical protein
MQQPSQPKVIKRNIRDAHVAFMSPCRNEAEEERVIQFARQWSPDPTYATVVGLSCVATARTELGAIVAETMPPDLDVVVMVDSDVWVGPSVLAGLIARTLIDSLRPAVFATYPIRVPKGQETEDRRTAHYLDEAGDVFGGLGMVAMNASTFRLLHQVYPPSLRETPLLSPEPLRIPPSTCPYRVGPFGGKWLTEDLFFCHWLKLNAVPSVLFPVPARHGGKRVEGDFKMLDGSDLPASLMLSEG